MTRESQKKSKGKPLKLVLILGLIVLGIIAGKYIIQAVSPPSWTDSTITAGETLIRKIHMDELRSEINANRADVGLATTTWTDSTITAGQTLIRAVHFTEARTALEGIFTTIGDSLPSWTNATITPGTTIIRKTHLDEVRASTTVAYDSINDKVCCGSPGCPGECPCSPGVDCGGLCESCDGINLDDCQFTADGQDYQNECNGLSCTGYYWGWSGNRCYYRANEPAETHNCEGNGTCRDVADDCPSNGQGSATGCSSASSACRAGCSGTTGPTCYTSGKHGCSTCYQCNSAGNCVSVTTSWGGGSAYGCSGSTKRCDSGTCRTCGSGVVKTDGCGGCVGQGGNACWYLGNTGQSCTSACSGHGNCIVANWDDTTTCTVMKTWSGCSNCCDGSSGRTNIPSLKTDYSTTCMYRGPSDGQSCGGTPGWGDHRRACVCRY